MVEKIREAIITFFQSLTGYDYLGFFVTMVLFMMLLFLALYFRHRTKLSFLITLIGFVFFFGGPVAVHALVKATLFKHESQVKEVRQLHYSDTLLVKGELHYLGKHKARYCEVSVAVHKEGGNFFKALVYKMKPLQEGSTKVEKELEKGETTPFKVVIEPFNYGGDYNITIASGCFK